MAEILIWRPLVDAYRVFGATLWAWLRGRQLLFLAVLFGTLSSALPADDAPGAKPNGIPLAELMQIIGEAKDYKDLISKMTHTGRKPNSWGAFFALHGDRTVTPTTPQIFMQFENMTLAYAPQMYAEIQYSIGEETVHFQLVERPGKNGISINAYTFASSARVRPAPEHEITPEEVLRMHTPELIQKTNRYAAVGCRKCHLNERRRLFEVDNYGRRFEADPGWQFRTEEGRRTVKEKLEKMFQEFTSGATQANPLYEWLWEMNDVKARDGAIQPGDTFTHEKFVHAMMNFNGNEMLGELKRHANWDANKDAFEAAVTGDEKELAAQLVRSGLSLDEIAKEKRRIEALHAKLNLRLFRNRNRENIAWVLAEGKLENVEKYMDNDFLLLNQHSIEKIGPAILDMIVTEEQWKKLTPEEKETKIRLSELAVKDHKELVAIVTSPKVRDNVTRRTAAHLVLARLLGTDKKALPFLSANVAFKIEDVGVETGGKGVDLLDIYAEALRNPKFSPINSPCPYADLTHLGYVR